LIALIINVHTLGRMYASAFPQRLNLGRRSLARTWRSRTLTRKTSLLRKIEPIARRSSFANEIIHNPHTSACASAEMIRR
jgi:hypothetical protein